MLPQLLERYGLPQPQAVEGELNSWLATHDARHLLPETGPNKIAGRIARASFNAGLNLKADRWAHFRERKRKKKRMLSLNIKSRCEIVPTFAPKRVQTCATTKTTAGKKSYI